MSADIESGKAFFFVHENKWSGRASEKSSKVTIAKVKRMDGVLEILERIPEMPSGRLICSIDSRSASKTWVDIRQPSSGFVVKGDRFHQKFYANEKITYCLSSRRSLTFIRERNDYGRKLNKQKQLAHTLKITHNPQ